MSAERPCIDRHPRPDPAGCRACWLYANDRRYRALWGGDPDDVPAEPPSVLRKAANLAGAVAAHLRRGLPTVDDAAYEARLAVCKGCPQHLPANDSCRVCGCRLSVKARWASQDCPQGRWPAPSGGSP